MQVLARMFTARKKISKDKGQEPDSFEESVAQVLLDFTFSFSTSDTNYTRRAAKCTQLQSTGCIIHQFESSTD